MTFRDVQTPNRSVWAALFAGLTLFLSGALSLVSFSIIGQSTSLAFLPLLVLAVWPRRANELASIILVFSAGIFTDWATGGVVGQWALTFTLVWMLLRPELREDPYVFLRAFLIWLGICALAMLSLSASGWLVYGILPDLAVFGRQILLATFCLPLALLLRHGLAKLFGGTDDWSR